MINITLDKNGLADTAGMITIYNYDAKTGEYINSAEEYFPQGLGVPANSTIVAPLVVKKNNVAVFREGKWQAIADHRGETVYAIADGAEIEVTEPGDYPAGTTASKPATDFDKWDGTKWVTDTEELNAAQVKSAERKKASLLAEAQAKISIWQTELQLGIIENEDKATLISWLSYIKALQKTDTITAPDIKWPVVAV